MHKEGRIDALAAALRVIVIVGIGTGTVRHRVLMGVPAMQQFCLEGQRQRVALKC